MTVIITAKHTAGLGCIKGEQKKYDNVRKIIRHRTYHELVIHENWKVLCNRKDWKVEVVDA